MNYIMHGTASEKEEILALYKSQLGREFCPWTEFYPTEKKLILICQGTPFCNEK